MKKSSFWMSLMFGLFVSVMAFTACSSDDDDSSSNPLVGTWYTEYLGKGEILIYSEVTFNADNTCTSRDYYSDQHTIKFSDTGTYKVEGNKLSIWWESEKDIWDKEGPWTTTFTIIGNKMMHTTEDGEATWTKK